jgi:hypothetical protein
MHRTLKRPCGTGEKGVQVAVAIANKMQGGGMFTTADSEVFARGLHDRCKRRVPSASLW